jgi:hypothetical protein
LQRSTRSLLELMRTRGWRYDDIVEKQELARRAAAAIFAAAPSASNPANDECNVHDDGAVLLLPEGVPAAWAHHRQGQ